MTRLTFILVALIACTGSYIAGRANPSDYHAAKLTAKGYDAGRQAVLDELPKPTPTTDQYLAWWTGDTDMTKVRRRLCGK